MTGTTSQQLSDGLSFHEHSQEEKNILSKLSISTTGDLTVVSGGERMWNYELRGLSTVIDPAMTEECPTDNIKLRPLQCWLVQDEEAYVAEILGFKGGEVVIRKWVLPLGTRKKTKGHSDTRICYNTVSKS
jgi:hypothetical protein